MSSSSPSSWISCRRRGRRSPVASVSDWRWSCASCCSSCCSSSAGIAFAFFIVLIYAVVASPLPLDDPELLEAGPPSMFVLYFPLFSAGWVLLGAAFVRIPFYPRWAVRLLGLGAVIALHP